MEDELIKYETAVLAKEKGFNIPQNKMYSFGTTMFDTTKKVKLFNGDKHECALTPHDWNNNVKSQILTNYYSAPTQSLLQRWLREVHDIHIEVLPRYAPQKLNTEDILYSWAIFKKNTDFDGHNDVLNHWIGIHKGPPYEEDVFYHIVKSYEEALEVGLLEALKLI